MSTLTQDQIILGGPQKKEESSSLNYPFRGEEPGPSMPIDGTMTAKDFFSRFFSDDVWELFTTATNRHAARLRQQVNISLPGIGTISQLMKSRHPNSNGYL